MTTTLPSAWSTLSGTVAKRQGLAEANMPVDGLSVDGEQVVFQDRPLRQCSTSEQLRVSMAVAMATDPAIRIVRIADGNDLDSTNLQLVADMAAEKDFQVWIELVDETGDRGFYIEAGQLAGAMPSSTPSGFSSQVSSSTPNTMGRFGPARSRRANW